jgi:hypothetical protein
VKDYVAGLVAKDKPTYGHLSELLANMEEDKTKNELGFTKHLSASEMKVALPNLCTPQFLIPENS